MNEDTEFSARIRAKFPEGLTGIFAVGGTRTGYVLEHNRQGVIGGTRIDLSDYATDILDKYFNLIDMFLRLGGQNIIITILAYQRFSERGEEYAEYISKSTLLLINDKSIEFYRNNKIDPYFVGIDTLIQLPETNPAHNLGIKLSEFNNSWHYKPSHYKLIWEVAAIPLYSFWKIQSDMSIEDKNKVESSLANTSSMDSMFDLLYKLYSNSVYGTEIPMPHFYLGTNRNGDMKIRALNPISLLTGGTCRLFFTPYPSLLITKNTLKTILDDLAFPKPGLRFSKQDYPDQYSPEMVEAEYQRVMQLSNDPNSTIGLTRTILSKNED